MESIFFATILLSQIFGAVLYCTCSLENKEILRTYIHKHFKPKSVNRGMHEMSGGALNKTQVFLHKLKYRNIIVW